MPKVRLKSRYYCLRPEKGKEESCANFYQKEKMLEIDSKETAFVIVDTWEIRGMSDYPFLPGCTRKDDAKIDEPIMRCRIKPVLKTARQIGLPIIYMPSDYVAVKYPEFRNDVPVVKSRKKAESWPPIEYRQKRALEYSDDRFGKRAWETRQLRMNNTYINKLVVPQKGDYVLSNGDELDYLLKKKKIRNLIYSGFALNMCLLDKPGAMRDMAGRGYFVILLRDCTAAGENNHTFPKQLMTKLFTEWIEMCMGYTTTSKEFIFACQKGRQDK